MMLFRKIGLVLFVGASSFSSVMATDVDAWFAQRTDSELLEGIVQIVEERNPEDEIIEAESSIPIIQRIVYAVWSLTGFIESGGIESFWSLGSDHRFACEAFSAAGLTRQAEVLRESLSEFPDSESPGDRFDLVEFFGTEEKLREAGGKYSSRFFRTSDEVKEILARYVRRNRSEFLALLCETKAGERDPGNARGSGS